MSGWKIPTTGDFIGAALGYIPRLIKQLKDRGRSNEVKKIGDAVASGDTKYINDKLRAIKKANDRRRTAAS